MSETVWKTGKRAREPKEELSNRDGHWTRDFSVRADPWLTVESWAPANGFILGATRGKRRLYQKSLPYSGAVVFLDIKEHELHVTLSAWIQFSLSARMAHLFLLPREVNPSPNGFLGVMARRSACRDLNSLLERLRQPSILGSESFHVADLDPSALLLAASLLLPLTLFFAGSIPKLEMKPALLPSLFSYWGKSALYLTLAAVSFTGIQQLLSARWLRETWMKAATSGLFFILTTTACILALGRVGARTAESKIVYNCLQAAQSPECTRVLETLPIRERQELFLKLQSLEKALTLRDIPLGSTGENASRIDLPGKKP